MKLDVSTDELRFEQRQDRARLREVLERAASFGLHFRELPEKPLGECVPGLIGIEGRDESLGLVPALLEARVGSAIGVVQVADHAGKIDLAA